MQGDIKGKTLKGIFWSFIERMSLQVVNFSFAVYMARLLMPAEFGQVAMLAIFMMLARSFIDSGFGQALIQKQDATPVDESSVFYLNVLISSAITLIFYCAAPFIADFYNTPVLVQLTRVLSLNLVISSLSVVQLSLLMKRVDFKMQMKISLAASLVSGSVGVTMAYNGFGVWSIVAQHISNSFVQMILLWTLNTWRPILVFSITSLKSMFNFGSKLLFSGLLNTVFDNIYYVIVGKLFSPTGLGFYSRARNLQMLPVGILTSSLNRVTFSVFSSVQDEKGKLKRGVRKVICMSSLVNFPMMVGLSVVSPSLIELLLTEKWLPCVPYFQLFCMIGILHPLYSINLNVLAAQGRSDLLLRMEFLYRGFQIIAIFITYRWGIHSLIIGQIVSSFIAFYLSTHYTGKLLGYPFFQQLKDLIPLLLYAAIMGLGVWGAGNLFVIKPIYMLLFQISVGVTLYPMICRIFRHSSFMELSDMAFSRLKTFSKEA